MSIMDQMGPRFMNRLAREVQQVSGRDCSKLRRGLGCIERNARKLCASCAEHSRKEQLVGLQEELDDVMEEMCGVEFQYGHSPDDNDKTAQLDVTALFYALILQKIPVADGCLDNMGKTSLPLLRRVSFMAGTFGLDQVANIIRKHITLRKGGH